MESVRTVERPVRLVWLDRSKARMESAHMHTIRIPQYLTELSHSVSINKILKSNIHTLINYME